MKLYFDAPLFHHLLDQQEAGVSAGMVIFSFASEKSQLDSHQPSLFGHPCLRRRKDVFLFWTRHDTRLELRRNGRGPRAPVPTAAHEPPCFCRAVPLLVRGGGHGQRLLLKQGRWDDSPHLALRARCLLKRAESWHI